MIPFSRVIFLASPPKSLPPEAETVWFMYVQYLLAKMDDNSDARSLLHYICCVRRRSMGVKDQGELESIVCSDVFGSNASVSNIRTTHSIRV
jgi:hypothetical protein